MKTVVEQIKSNWAILGFIIAMVIWYADTNNRLATVEKVEAENKSSIDIITTSYTEIKADLSSIKTDISWIKNRID